MENIAYIQEQLKMFEKYIKKQEGGKYLEAALDAINTVLEESDYEGELKICKNMLSIINKSLKEMAFKATSHSNPNAEELFNILSAMRIFQENSICEDQEFKDAYGKIGTKCVESISGRLLEDSLKAELYINFVNQFGEGGA